MSPASRSLGRRIAMRTVGILCAIILALGALVAGYLTFLSFVITPSGPWDHEAITYSKFTAGTTLAITAITAALTWVGVRTRLLRRWWFALPFCLACAALLRLTVLAPTL